MDGRPVRGSIGRPTVTRVPIMAAQKRSDEGLTPKERQVARWIAQAKTNWEIGTILGISTRTVEKHVEHLLRKLRVENRTAAALELVRHAAFDFTEHD